MFPAYGYTKHSYPQRRPHMSSDCRLHQGIPPQMKMEASNSPFMYETWPHHYGYPVPTQCHSCCNHNPYPSYYPYTYRPPYPLDPQFYGGYPVYPQPYSFHYPPPPQYTMELPKYEYDQSHCCGCSHLKPDMSGDKGVKIVEQGSDAVNKEDSLVPSDYIKNHDSKGVGEEPKLWSGWMPLDMDNLKRLLQDGNLRKDVDDQPRNSVHQTPFPMVWLPYNNEEKGQMSTALESSKQQPFRTEQGDDHIQKPNPAVAAEVKKPPRIIPVKQMDETADMKTKNIEKGNKSKPSSPTKASRLPPICLRVDPLPKRRNGQGKSRSPSPPGDKVKPVEVVKPSSSIADGAANAEVVKVPKVAGDELRSEEAVEKKPEEAIKPEKKILSGNEAATIIQSAYRGYEVRRWEPLKKMRQIANIREEAAALKRRIESSANSMELKQKTALGETIMNLLLKLDTVQGLHSSIRDIRKSVAKELVSLQEMLDTIVIKQPDVSSQGPDINQDADESSLSSGLSKTKDLGAVEMGEDTKDQISSLHGASAQEPCIGPEFSNSGPEGIGEEVGELLSDSFTEQNGSDIVEEAAIKNVAEEASIKPVDQEPSPAVADTNHDLLDESPVAAVMEEDFPPASETRVIEPDKLQESEEASKVQVTIEQDADEEDAKLDEEEVKLAIPSTENTIPSTENIVKEENEKMRDMLEKLIASGKEQQQVICSLNEKLRELEDKLAKQKQKQKQKKKRGSRTRKARVLMNGSLAS